MLWTLSISQPHESQQRRPWRGSVNSANYLAWLYDWVISSSGGGCWLYPTFKEKNEMSVILKRYLNFRIMCCIIEFLTPNIFVSRIFNRESACFSRATTHIPKFKSLWLFKALYTPPSSCSFQATETSISNSRQVMASCFTKPCRRQVISITGLGQETPWRKHLYNEETKNLSNSPRQYYVSCLAAKVTVVNSGVLTNMESYYDVTLR